MVAKKDEHWQAYNKHGLPIKGKSFTRDEAYKGALHAASHIWAWRRSSDGSIEVLLQKRAPQKRTWPNCWDISAAGHIDLGEIPLKAAIRETKEELGLTIKPLDMRYTGCYWQTLRANDKDVENEFCFIYLLECNKAASFTLESDEVATVTWKPLAVLQQEVLTGNPEQKAAYVAHGAVYYAFIIDAIMRHAE
jgi:isopentenyl-diphosphate Delta-isomerase